MSNDQNTKHSTPVLNESLKCTNTQYTNTILLRLKSQTQNGVHKYGNFHILKYK